DHRSPHQSRDDGDLWQGEGYDRSELVDEGTSTPSRNRDQLQREREGQLDKGCDDEGRYGAAGRRDRNDGIVFDPVLLQSRNDAERASDNERHDQRGGTKLRRHTKTLAEDFRDGEIWHVVTGPEITVQKIVEIVRILPPERLIETEFPFEIG